MAWLNSDLAPGVDTAAIDDIRNTDWMQPAASQFRNFDGSRSGHTGSGWDNCPTEHPKKGELR